jgi:hypothetical protein
MKPRLRSKKSGNANRRPRDIASLPSLGKPSSSPTGDLVPPYQHCTGLHIDNKNVEFRHDFTTQNNKTLK